MWLMKRVFFLLMLVIGLSGALQGQFQVKLGYGIQFHEREPNNIFRYFSTRYPYLNLGEKKYTNTQSVIIGVRSRGDYAAVGLNFGYGFWTLSGQGQNPDNGTDEWQKVALIRAAPGLELEFIGGPIGIGAEGRYVTFTEKLRSSVTGTHINRQHYGAVRPFASIYLPGSSNTELSLRLYYELALGTVSLDYTESVLNPNRAGQFEQGAFDYRPSGFGLQLLFLNFGG